MTLSVNNEAHCEKQDKGQDSEQDERQNKIQNKGQNEGQNKAHREEEYMTLDDREEVENLHPSI